ncbi:PIN domain-containing protein [Burkholderia sp. AU38729]|uniref:PIN domain-containing protein n=1 Tax=Burkholderia sp. AU38729 TaxID=2879633 RepID=UPI001CF5CA45|nr:PIN domain-containing protein [Burkholderia sp. AU38729]MCA8061711.1 PIN domain-containing protein [Burkholderia sp. AU38729]
MKDIFPGHYRPEQKEIEQMWAEAIFVFDANALLNLYRYTEDTRETFIQTLEALRDRVWIPYQVCSEFFQNKTQVMSTIALGYSKLREELGKARADLGKVLNGFRRHPGIDVDDITKVLDKTFSKLNADLEAKEEKHPDWITNQDPILERLTAIFSGKVGERPEPAQYKKIIEEAKSRFDNSKPPGLRDKEKGGVQQYGDAILWLEIIQRASNPKSAIIFITDDVKDDWWQRVGGRTIGPLPELRQELWDAAKAPLHMYQCDQFLKYASKFLDRQLPESSIEEAKEVRDELQHETSELQKWTLSDVVKVGYPLDGQFKQIKDALWQYDYDYNERPALVADYRGPTLAIQVKNLVGERNRLSKMFLELRPDMQESEYGREIRKAIYFVDREINAKTAFIRPGSEMWDIVFGPSSEEKKN